MGCYWVTGGAGRLCSCLTRLTVTSWTHLNFEIESHRAHVLIPDSLMCDTIGLLFGKSDFPFVCYKDVAVISREFVIRDFLSASRLCCLEAAVGLAPESQGGRK